MRFTANRPAMADAARWVSTAIAARPSHPALAGVWLTAAEGSGLALGAHDFDAAHRLVMPDADVSTFGEIILPGAMLRDLLAALRGDTVTAGLEGDTLVLKAGRSTYRLNTIPVDDYPKPPNIAGVKAVGKIDAEELRRCVAVVDHCADDLAAVSRIRGIRLEAGDGEFRAVAMRTTGLALAKAEWPKLGEPFAVQLPVGGVVSAIRGLAGDVTISVDGSLLVLADDVRTVTLRTYDVEIVDWRPVVPDYGPHTIQVESEELNEATRRAALTVTGDAALALVVEHGEVTVTAGADDGASGVEVLDVADQTDDVTHTVHLTADVVTATLGALPAGLVAINLGGKAVHVTTKAGDHHVLMTRRLR